MTIQAGTAPLYPIWEAGGNAPFNKRRLTLGRQYELVKVEDRGFAEQGEVLSAARRAKEEERMKKLMQKPVGGMEKAAKEKRRAQEKNNLWTGKEDPKSTWQKK